MLDCRALVEADAAHLARAALAVLQQRYPHKLDHLIVDADDRPRPADIHPVFDGCYDWHSSVHMHWSLLRLCRAAPQLWERPEIEAHFAAHFTEAHVERELAYAKAPGRSSFERPYGWAWLLKLQIELNGQLARCEGPPRLYDWAAALLPMSALFANRLTEFLGRCEHPVRAGTHANSAFSMLLALEYAEHEDVPLRAAIVDASRRWFERDTEYPVRYEPSATDFLSPGLCEALLMFRVLPRGTAWRAWWDRFMPGADRLAGWLEPVAVGDRRDAQLVHLEGLNLSRAWCLASLASALPDHADALKAAGDRHWLAAWPHVFGGDFVATHWLLSFALLSLDVWAKI